MSASCFNHRQFAHRECENRLCLLETGGGSKEVYETGSWAVPCDAIGVWIQDKFKDNKAEAEAQMHAVANFSRVMPASVQRTIMQKLQTETAPGTEEFGRLFDLKNWVDIFSDQQWMNIAQESATLLDGPKGIIQELNPEQRRQLYFQFVRSIIPPEVSDLHIVDETGKVIHSFQDVFGPSKVPGIAGNLEPVRYDTRVLTMLEHDNVRDISQAMKYILGIEEPDVQNPTNPGKAYNIASASLMARYRRIEQDGTGSTGVNKIERTWDPMLRQFIVRGGGMNDGFFEDLERANGKEFLLGSMDELRTSLAPSFLKGALHMSMGVIGPKDIKTLRADLANRQAERELNRGRTAEELREYTGVVKLEKSREAETLADKFMNLGGIEKVALIAIATWMLMNKKVRFIAGGLGLLYFGQKFLLNQDNPINDIWKPQIQNLTKMIPGIGIFSHEKYTDDELQKRGALMEGFLSEHVRNDMDSAATGFTLLSDMSLGNLAQHFYMSSDGSLAALRFDNPDFKREIEKLTTLHGLKRSAAQRFFEGGRGHAIDAGDALATVFYFIAIRDPKYRKPHTIIEDYRRKNGFGQYDSLPIGSHRADLNGDGEMEDINLRETYAHLVRVGKTMASGESMTLLEFVQQDMFTDTRSTVFKPTSKIVPSGSTGL